MLKLHITYVIFWVKSKLLSLPLWISGFFLTSGLDLQRKSDNLYSVSISTKIRLSSPPYIWVFTREGDLSLSTSDVPKWFDAEPYTIEAKKEEFFANKRSESTLSVGNATRRMLADHHKKIRFSEYSVLKLGLYFSWPTTFSPTKPDRYS